MSYLFFDADREGQFDTENGQGSLGEHLDYLANSGGTPDCYDAIDADIASVAIAQARKTGLHLLVVDYNALRVVGEVNKPTLKSA